MIIQCEQCNTKFRLDDSKVTAKGVKVRCAKCKHVFAVRQEQPTTEETSDFGALLDRKTDLAPEEQPSPPEQPDTSPFSAAGFETSTYGENVFSEEPFSMATPDVPRDTVEQEQTADDQSGFSFPDDQQSFSIAQDEPPSTTGDVDFSEFDFGGHTGDAESVPGETPAPEEDAVHQLQESAPPAAANADGDFDFGSDNLFGDAVAPAVEEPGTAINFDFQMDEFADSLGVQRADGENKSAEEPRPEEPFSLGEIDFGDELTAVAVQQVNPDELKPGQDHLFAPLGSTPGKLSPASEETQMTLQPPEESSHYQEEEELPPLSISSRRKQSSALTALITVLGVVAVAALGFYGYTTLRGTQGGAVQDTGKITLRGINASYVKNSTAGNLLVISGEAVNEFKKPRAAIQVKGMVYGANGQVLSSKSAYGGNPLTPDQLATMPMEKIEAAMANQFGDSLANLEVAPGKAIPFAIVIPGPPAEAKDYGVEPAGSTVATGKQ